MLLPIGIFIFIADRLIFIACFDIYYWGVSHPTRLIGWNDEDFRKVLEEHRRRRKEDPSRPNLEETGFGLMGTLANTLKEAVYKKTNFDDFKSDLKKIEDSGGSGGTVSLGESTNMDSRDQHASISSSSKPVTSSTSSTSSSMDIIGSNVNVKEMKVYKNILSAIQYQRDAYIMGIEHADKRRLEREAAATIKPKIQRSESVDVEYREHQNYNEQHKTYSQEQQTKQQSSSTANDHEIIQSNKIILPVTVTYKDILDRYPSNDICKSSLGNTQLNGLLTWFIPSKTMHNALLPTVLWTIAPPTSQYPDGGPLRRIINRSVCDLIPLSQGLLDATMKSSILWVLSDDSWRESVKGSSRNYLTFGDGVTVENGGASNSSNSIYQHGNGNSTSSNGGRVVVTKTVRMK